jgi:hypothetical protein
MAGKVQAVYYRVSAVLYQSGKTGTLYGGDPWPLLLLRESHLNSVNKQAAQAIEDISSGLLFSLTGGHYDNCMEFTNKPLLARCQRYVKAARSRTYRKNGNCFAE